MAKRWLASWLFVLFAIGCAVGQSDLAATAVPDQNNGKDYAGRPLENPPVPQAPTLNPVQKQTVEQSVRDIHFAFDRSDIIPEQRAVLQADAEWLKAHPNNFIVIEGDADERGGIAYNVALSDRRAIAARDALLAMGVPASQILFAVGWGKLYPVCSQSDEACWEQNRRAHISPW
jgi:peptidoglycan-associated lipoprotein